MALCLFFSRLQQYKDYTCGPEFCTLVRKAVTEHLNVKYSVLEEEMGEFCVAYRKFTTLRAAEVLLNRLKII